MDLLIIEPIDAEVMRWLGSRAPASLRARARVRPARLSPCALQRQRSHRAAVGQHRRRDARLRAGAARRRPGQRRRREHRPRSLRAAQGRGRSQPDRQRPGRGRVHRSARCCRCCGACRCAAPTARSSGASSAAPPSAWSAWRPSARTIVAAARGLRRAHRRLRPGAARERSRRGRWQVDAAGLRELVEHADVLCVQLDYFSRYHGLLGERFLRHCKTEPGDREHRPLGPVRRGRAGRRRCRAAASPPPGSTAWSPARSIRTGRCTASRRCR